MIFLGADYRLTSHYKSNIRQNCINNNFAQNKQKLIHLKNFIFQESLNSINLRSIIFFSQMIFSQMPQNSPQFQDRTINFSSQSLLHFNIKQLSSLRMHNDDILCNNTPVNKFVLIARLISVQKQISQRGLAVLRLKLEDSTGLSAVQIYEKDWNPDCYDMKGKYVKIGGTIKCGGLAYRPEIKVIANAIVLVSDFNQLTEHFLECIKTMILAQM